MAFGLLRGGCDHGRRGWRDRLRAGTGSVIRLAVARARVRFAVDAGGRHFVAIHRDVHHRVGAAAADDLTSATFARAFAARHRVRTIEGSLRAWLFTIASNLVADGYRTRGRAGQAHERLRSAASTAFDAVAEWAADPTGRLHQNPDLTDAVLALWFKALLLLAWGELSPPRSAR